MEAPAARCWIPDAGYGAGQGGAFMKIIHLISGGDVDTERMAKILLDEFRAGKLGRFTLELPE